MTIVSSTTETEGYPQKNKTRRVRHRFVHHTGKVTFSSVKSFKATDGEAEFSEDRERFYTAEDNVQIIAENNKQLNNIANGLPPFKDADGIDSNFEYQTKEEATRAIIIYVSNLPGSQVLRYKVGFTYFDTLKQSDITDMGLDWQDFSKWLRSANDIKKADDDYVIMPDPNNNAGALVVDREFKKKCEAKK